MFIYGEFFLTLVNHFRVVTIVGRYGGGKTLLSVAVSKYLLDNGFVSKVVTNFPCSFASPPSVPLVDSAIVLDEAWTTLFPGASHKQIMTYLAFLRKLNNILLLPSVVPLSKRVNVLEVVRYLNCEIFGLPLWIYRWRLRATGERGYFALLFPFRYYNLYDHSYVVTDDRGIGRALMETVRVVEKEIHYEHQQEFIRLSQQSGG
jgi:hypothetical protein